MKLFGRFLLGLCIFCTGMIGAFPTEAAFEKTKKNIPGILVCEVNGYGENILRQEYFYTFEELLLEKLQKSNKFSVEFKQNAAPVMTDGRKMQLDEFFAELHKHAIVSGKYFDKDQACIELVRYCEQHPYKPGNTELYELSGDFKEKTREIGAMHNVQYLLFCNLKNVDIKLKNHQLTPNFEDLKGMKIMADIDYYLINADSGAVYEGHSFTNKTTQIFNLILLKYGKKFDVQQLVQCILETQAERVVEDISGKGLNKVKNYV